MSKKKVLLEQKECPNPSCGSSDAFSIYLENGRINAHCYSCGYNVPDLGPYKDYVNSGSLPTESEQIVTTRVPSSEKLTVSECLTHPIRELSERKISYSTCEHFGVRVGVDTANGTTPIYHLYPYYDEDNEITGYKQRIIIGKQFKTIGQVRANQLFGLNKIKSKGNKLFITTGELDAMSLYQALKETSNVDWDPDVLSIACGDGSAVKAVSENFDIINSYEQVILAFDQDAPGKKAAKEVAKLLAGKSYIATISEKDPNDMLKANKALELKWAVLTNARKYQPDGIVNAADCWDRYKQITETDCYPYPSTMPGLSQKLYGAFPGSLIVVTSGSGCGKTQFLRELKYHYWATTNEKIADIALEEDLGDSIGGMLSLHLNKRITLPDVDASEEEEKNAFKDLFGDRRFTCYDFFGGMDDDNLFSKLRYFTSTGHKFIFLDHLSIIVSEYAAEGGERERIDTIMTKLAKLVKETGAIIFLVVHLKKSDFGKGKTFEQGTVPSLDDLRGSGSLKQLAWDVIGISRNQQHEIKACANTSELHVLKSRKTGRTGKAGYLLFDDNTGRMIHTECPSGYYDLKS